MSASVVVVVVVAVLALIGLCAAQPVFQDVSAAAGLTPELKRKYYGPCIADIDRDGRYDLVLTNHNLDPVDWYWSSGADSFRKESGLALRFNDFHGISAADLDGDGDLDVMISIGGMNGDQPGRPFVVETLPERRLSISRGTKYGLGKYGMRGRLSRFIDMDGDGDLDILYVSRLPENPRKFHAHHLVYENLGSGKYRPRPELNFGSIRSEWVTLIDVDGDGHQDILFILWDSVQLWMWRGPFQYENESWRIPGASGMKWVRCGAEFDMDNDGDFDLYLSRVLRTSKIKHRSRDVLLENRGGVFHVVSAGFPRTDHTHVSAADFDNDGLMDLYLTRYGVDRIRHPDVVLMNRGGGRFDRFPVRGDMPWNTYGEHGESGTAFDYDMDGRVDVLSASAVGQWRLLKNVASMTDNHYLIVRVGRPNATEESPDADCDPLGAVVQLDLGDVIITRRVGSAGESHSQQYLDTLHFGLGPRTVVDRIIVTYENGLKQIQEGPTAVDTITTFGRLS